jgi:excisionase family DNA binding protein
MSEKQEQSPMLTPGEVARAFSADSRTVTRWARKGWITAIKTPGGHRRYRRDEVMELLARDGR